MHIHKRLSSTAALSWRVSCQKLGTMALQAKLTIRKFRTMIEPVAALLLIIALPFLARRVACVRGRAGREHIFFVAPHAIFIQI
jgi:hypothetical protein